MRVRSKVRRHRHVLGDVVAVHHDRPGTGTVLGFMSAWVVMSGLTLTFPAETLLLAIAPSVGLFQVLLDRYGATNPRLFGSIARGTAHSCSDIDILVDMDSADGNLLMRASGLMEEARALFGRDDVDVFPVQLLKRPISASALDDAVPL